MFPEVKLKTHIFVLFHDLSTHMQKNQPGCSNVSWDTGCERGKLIKVTSKSATSHIG